MPLDAGLGPPPRIGCRRGAGRRPGARLPLVVGAGADRPVADRARPRLLLLGPRRQPLPRSRIAARQRQHRPPAPAPGRRDPGAGGEALHGVAGVRGRRAERRRPADRRARAGRPRRRVLHQRRRGGERERDPYGAPAHGPAQGAGRVPQLPRCDRGLDRAHRRTAPVAERAGPTRRRALLGAVPLPVVVPRGDRGRGVRRARSATSAKS